jgi:hypothetical protein
LKSKEKKLEPQRHGERKVSQKGLSMKKGLALILIAVTGFIALLLSACGGASSSEANAGAAARELGEAEVARPLFPAAIDEDFREDSQYRQAAVSRSFSLHLNYLSAVEAYGA